MDNVHAGQCKCCTGTGQTLKYVSLVTLTLQNAMVGLSMRYSRTRAGDMFLSSTGKYKWHWK